MINWLIDRVWAWKNRGALAELDAEMAAINAMSARLDERMLEAFGPDWREQSERRLAEVMQGRYTFS